MIVHKRLKEILNIVNCKGQVEVKELCESLNVSEATIRRDLAALAEEGLLKRIRGGALAKNPKQAELPVITRQRENSTAKRAIGRAAAELVKPGDTVFIGSGSTTVEVARALKERLELEDITVISNSLPVVNIFADERRFSLIVVGGYLRHGEQSAIGWIAEKALEELRADKVIIGISALSVNNGLMSSHMPEVLTDRSILEIGSQVIVVADYSKFNREEAVRLAPISVVDVVVTDRQTTQNRIEELRERGIEVVVATASCT